jgi:hypothetical protein
MANFSRAPESPPLPTDETKRLKRTETEHLGRYFVSYFTLNLFLATYTLSASIAILGLSPIEPHSIRILLQLKVTPDMAFYDLMGMV